MGRIPGLGGGGRRTGGGRGRDGGFLGVALECEPRGQISGQSPGVFENPTTDDFIVDSILECGTFTKGANWEVYADAAVARGANASHIVEDATTVKFTQSSTLPFMSLFDAVFVNPFQNGGIPPITIKKVKDLAAAAGQKGALGISRPPFFAFHGWKDDMPTGPHTSTLWQKFYEACKAGVLWMRGTGLNTDGILACDPQEGQAWTGSIVDPFDGEETPFGTVSGHNWELDYRIRHFAETIAQAAFEQWRDYWSAGGASGESIDAWYVHDLLPFFGGAYRGETNAPTVDSGEWIAGVERIVDAYRRKLKGGPWKIFTSTGRWPGRLSGGGTDVPGVPGIFYSYHFVDDPVGTMLEQTKADVSRQAAVKRPVVFGNQEMDATYDGWFTEADRSEWWEILSHARAESHEGSTFVASSNTSYLFWSPAMRRIG